MVLCCALLAQPARAQQSMTTMVSVDSSGTFANSASFSPSISTDGRFVAFSSVASNLIPVDNNFSPDVFVRDRSTGQTVRASVSSSGAQGNGISWFPAISGDGRIVVFTSFAENLVPGDTNGNIDVFVHDLQTAVTARVSVSSSGAQADLSSGYVATSTDGRFVAFDGDATVLVPGDTNAMSDVFVHDRVTAQTVRVSVASSGAQGDGASYIPSMSGDGRFVAFASASTNFVALDTNSALDVFVHDRATGQTTRASLDSSRNEANGDCSYPAISDDGRFVAFESTATNLVPNDVNGQSDVFVRDLQSGTTSIASLDSAGIQGNGSSSAVSISADGHFVSFSSSATNLVPGGTAPTIHVFRHDLQTGLTELWSADSNGIAGDGGSFFSSISADGQTVAFESEAMNLVAGDTNLTQDIFVRERGAPPPTSFCSGDGSGTACPCGNAGAPGNGCANSLFTSGARLVATGSSTISNDTLRLVGSNMPNAQCIYLQGNSQANGGLGAVFGDGLRCAGGTIIRLGRKLNVAGTSQYPAPGDLPISLKGLIPTAGGVRTYQAWYRNADASFCTVNTFNLTNGIEAIWVP